MLTSNSCGDHGSSRKAPKFRAVLHRTPSRTLFFFNDTATTEIYTLSLHDALPIYMRVVSMKRFALFLALVLAFTGNLSAKSSEETTRTALSTPVLLVVPPDLPDVAECRDRKSTRLNSSH